MIRYYENPEFTSENRENPRSYYIPKGAAKHIDLNGVWNFAYFENGDAAQIPEHFSDNVTVPSCWQMLGYENPNYTNINFPFLCDEPYVPQINPCGIYRREFTLSDTEDDCYLVFEGVSSLAEVYVNGKYVGFSEGSHLQAEYLLNGFVEKGVNTLTVKVYKWCSGSYLEDQDMFRCNGIFRDVYLLVRPKGHLKDIEIRTKDNDILITADKPSEVTLCFDGKILARENIENNGKITVENPQLWTAETPNLYTLEFRCAGEIITLRTGFRTIEIDNDYALRINGTTIKLKGVNHHDTSAVGGWYMTDEEMLTDLKKMKELNINTIRTSHYPPHPKFLDWCDEMGFYVVLENDVESHGFVRREPNVEYSFRENEHFPGKNPRWKKELLERMNRTYMRDRNHSSIIMWSTGNESGFSDNYIAMIEMLKSFDDGRIVICEDASRALVWYDIEYPITHARMYMPFDELIEKAENPEFKKGIFLVEYAHAMGNGPGDIWDYCEQFYKHKKLWGGCIWEWADHTVIVDGVAKYGGDFKGELTHDANFCCDGMVFYDRSFKAGSLEVKAAYAPFRFSVDKNKIIVNNLFDFTSLKDYDIKYKIACDGTITKEDTLRLDIPAHGSKEITLKNPLPSSCKLAATVAVTLIKDGYEIATLQQEPDCEKIPEKNPSNFAKLTEDKFNIFANGDNFSYVFSKQYGNFTSIVIDGKEQLTAPVKFSAFRALTDNEGHLKDYWLFENIWQGENLDRELCNVYSSNIVDGKIVSTASIGGVSRRPAVKYTLCVSIFDNGKISFEISGNTEPSKGGLPRLGFNFTLPTENNAFRYFGYGKTESYCDMKHHALLDYHESNTELEYVNYIYPQEHGNHTGVRELTIGNMRFECRNGMDINVSKYSAHDILKATHTDELPEKTYATHLRIDYKCAGIGSHSCGPELQDKYKVDDRQFTFKFSLSPKY